VFRLETVVFGVYKVLYPVDKANLKSFLIVWSDLGLKEAHVVKYERPGSWKV
jgi:hypothetical protein